MVSNLPWGTAFWRGWFPRNGSNMKPPTSPQNRWPIVPSCTLYTLGSGRRMCLGLEVTHETYAIGLVFPTSSNQTILKCWPSAFKSYLGLSRYWWPTSWLRGLLGLVFSSLETDLGFGKRNAQFHEFALCVLDQTLKMSESVTNFVKKLKGTFTNDPLSSRKNHGFPAFRRPHIIN